MPAEPQEIEVEVLEFTDLARPPAPRLEEETSAATGGSPFPDFRQWGGRVKTLDMRWWPLWLLLGIIATALIATLGLVALVFFLIVKILRGIWRALGGR